MAYHIIAQLRRMEYPQLDEWIINHLFPTWASRAAGAQFGTRIQRWLGSVSAGGVFQPLWICGNLCVRVFYRQAIADSKRERAAASSATASSSEAKIAEPKSKKKMPVGKTVAASGHPNEGCFGCSTSANGGQASLTAS